EKLVGVAAIEQVGQRIPGRLPFELFRLRAQIARALLDEALEAVPHRRKLTYHEHAERQDHEEKRERRRIHSIEDERDEHGRGRRAELEPDRERTEELVGL